MDTNTSAAVNTGTADTTLTNVNAATVNNMTAGDKVPADFDAVFYANMYPDVAKAVGTDKAALYKHYAECGYLEGRMPNCLNEISYDSTLSAFDADWYAAAYPDVAQVLGDDAENLFHHFIMNGFYEGRLPNADAASDMAALLTVITANAAQ